MIDWSFDYLFQSICFYLLKFKYLQFFIVLTLTLGIGLLTVGLTKEAIWRRHLKLWEIFDIL